MMSITPAGSFGFTSCQTVRSPVSISMKDYANRSAAGQQVDLATPGAKLLGYRIVIAADTVPLEKVAFEPATKTLPGGGTVLTYTVTTSYASSAAARVDGCVVLC